MSLADEIEKLWRLRDNGTMTEAEFQRAKALVLDGRVVSASKPAGSSFEALNRLTRSTTDRWAGGVCGGLANVTPLAAWVWRFLFSVLAVIFGIGPILYVLLWIFVPSEASPTPVSKPATIPDDLS
jgi:phage shock protein PspC (stress-responsive transcriptional regulator)